MNTTYQMQHNESKVMNATKLMQYSDITIPQYPLIIPISKYHHTSIFLYHNFQIFLSRNMTISQDIKNPNILMCISQMTLSQYQNIPTSPYLDIPKPKYPLNPSYRISQLVPSTLGQVLHAIRISTEESKYCQAQPNPQLNKVGLS